MESLKNMIGMLDENSVLGIFFVILAFGLMKKVGKVVFTLIFMVGLALVVSNYMGIDVLEFFTSSLRF